jgi:transposase-like protein
LGCSASRTFARWRGLVSALRAVLPRLGELLAELGMEFDHVTVFRWVNISTQEFIDAAERRASSSSTE